MDTTRVMKLATDEPTIKVGLGGNFYVFGTNKESVKEVCVTIGKAISSIIFHQGHKVWMFRVKHPKHKQALRDYHNEK